MLARAHLVESAPLPYLVSVPGTSAVPAIPLPVLCFLHGYDEGAPTEIRDALTRHGPLRPDSWPGAVERCIVVAPQLPTRGDLWHRHTDAVVQVVAEVQHAHGGDRTRTYLTGFSFGGNGVFDLALLHPDRWAALWAVDPTRPPARPLAHPVWLSVGALARPRKAAFIRAMALRAADESPEGGDEDRLYRDQGADHVGAATLAYRDERIYRWLLARRRPGTA